MKRIKAFLKKNLNWDKLFKNKDLIKDEPNVKYRLANNVEFSNSTIGDYSYVSPSSKIHSAIIGKYCSIGPSVIIGYGEHPIKFLSTSPLFYYGTQKFDIKIATKDYFNHHEKVIIKNDVWIGAHVYIKNGVTIGNGAVIAAGAVVVNDVPDYAIVGGIPSKIIKYRFETKIIEQLLKIKWWDWNISKIQKNKDFFVNEDINEVLKNIENKNEDQ